MRLICGLVRLDGASAERQTLEAMVTAQTAPGLSPQVRRRVEGPAALAVLDFAPERPSTDLPQGAGGGWLAGDLRLDRPAELAATLGLPPDAPPETLALAAFDRWGEDLPDHLHGDFALALWRPDLQRLVLARDIMGSRPLCYAYEPGRLFAFASLPKGLAQSGVVEPQLDRLALGRLAVQIAPRGAATGHVGVSWLTPAHTLTVTSQGLRLHRAWRQDPSRVGTWRGSPDEAARQLRELVEQAVAARLPPRGPVAAHLSGGLDSSAIAVIAARRQRARGERLHAYSQVPELTPGLELQDEREFILPILAQEPDVVWTAMTTPPIGASDLTDPDLPFLAQASTEDAVCADAAAAGARLLLSGAGGDETATYNANAIYVSLLRQGRWVTLPGAIRARARFEGRPLWRIVKERLVGPFIPQWLVLARRRLLGLPLQRPAGGALEFLRPPFRDEVRSGLAPAPVWRNRPKDRIALLTDSYIFGRANNWAIIAARHGLAFTYPLLDRRVIDFILSLPLHLFLRGGQQRQPYREAMAGVLPDEVRHRESKYAAFPDMPIRYAAAKPVLLKRLAAVRGQSDLAALIDFDVVAQAIDAAPEGEAAIEIARGLRPGQPGSAEFRRAMEAMRVLVLAEHMARHG
jgi:asparagine synthase (glutamine-hydrolysing)